MNTPVIVPATKPAPATAAHLSAFQRFGAAIESALAALKEDVVDLVTFNAKAASVVSTDAQAVAPLAEAGAMIAGQPEAAVEIKAAEIGLQANAVVTGAVAASLTAPNSNNAAAVLAGAQVLATSVRTLVASAPAA